MQVLLTNNVEKLGSRGDVVSVKDGYARNYLIPQGLAISVREGNLKSLEFERKRLQRIAEKERSEIAALGQKISEASVTITAAANEEGTLFGSIGPKEIAEALAKVVAEVEQSAVRLETHIKELGVYDVPIRLSGDVEVTTKVYVVGEQQPKEAQG